MPKRRGNRQSGGEGSTPSHSRSPRREASQGGAPTVVAPVTMEAMRELLEGTLAPVTKHVAHLTEVLGAKHQRG